MLVVASGKANNSEEFQPFGVRLDPETMTYDRDNSIDLEEWKERVGADTKSTEPRATISTVVETVESRGLEGIDKPQIIAAVMKETGVGKTYAYKLLAKAESKKAVIRRKCDKLYVAPKS